MSRSSYQSGNVFFLILAAVAMFAALAWVFTQNSRQSSGALTSEQTRLAAQEIVAYGNQMAEAVQKLKLRGCTDIQMDFSGGGSKKGNGTLYPYSNSNAPADGSCNVFNANGGKMSPPSMTAGSIDPLLPTQSWMHSQSFFVSASRVAGVGNDTTSDLILWYGRLTKDTCYAINKLLGLNGETGATIPDAFNCNAVSFSGSYPWCSDPIGDINTALAGKTAFCNEFQNDGFNYTFYQVLLAR